MIDEADQTRVHSYEFLGVDEQLAIALAKRDKQFETLADEVEPILEAYATAKKVFWIGLSGVVTVASGAMFLAFSE